MPLKFEKLHEKAQDAIKENNTYEALQIFRTVRNRCKTEENAQECLEMLYQAAIHFGTLSEKTTVLDLAEVYAETLIAFKVKPSDDIYLKIAKMLELLPITVTSTADPKATDLRAKFVNDVFKWSKDTSTQSFRKMRGDPRLHKQFALFHWKHGAYSIARLHFLLANDPVDFAKFLIDYTTSDEAIEEGDPQNYVLQAVLQLLAYKKLQIAQVLFAVFCRDHPAIHQTFPFKGCALLNFAWLLLAALEQNDLKAFVYALDKYQPILYGDCEYKSALDKVAQVYFKVPPRNNAGFGGMFGGLLKGFMSSGETAKEEFSADEEMAGESSRFSCSLITLPFADLNAQADSSNPPGLIQEPVVEIADEADIQQTPVAPSNTDMDLD